MSKRTDIKKIMIIGSGPIVIGQAAEFDYAGTQACLALKEEGYEVVLCNSNPATIMTDTSIADKVYMLSLIHIQMCIRDRDSTNEGCSASYVQIVDSDGFMDYDDCDWNVHGVRPFCSLESSICVSVE